MKTIIIILSITLSFAALAQEAVQLNRRTLLNSNFSTRKGLVKVAFFDADSTLRVSLSGSVSANNEKDVMLLPFVSQRIAELNQLGYLIMVVSNQGGVAKGLISIQTADSALKYMTELISAENPMAQIHYIDFADQEDKFRKPLTGMAENISNELAQKGLKIDWNHSFMVGDSAYKTTDLRPNGDAGTHFSNSDRLFAENLKIPFYEPNEFFGWKCHNIDVFEKAEQVKKFVEDKLERCDITVGPMKLSRDESQRMN